jgi:hypothetical protein
MARCVGQTVELVDAEQRQLGQMRIERQAEDLLYGTFVPGPAFPGVEQLFRDFEAAVDVQALHTLETLDAAIVALGLYLYWSEARESIAVQDVQIWRDGSITCRLCNQPAAPVQDIPPTSLSRHSAEATHRLA